MKLCLKIIVATILICLISAKPTRRGPGNGGNGHRRGVDAKTGFEQHEQRRHPSNRRRSFADRKDEPQGIPSPVNATSGETPQDTELTTTANDTTKRLTARDLELSIVSDVYSPSGELSIAVNLDTPAAELSISSKWNPPPENPSNMPLVKSPTAEQYTTVSATQLSNEVSPTTNAINGATTSTKAPNPCQGLTKPQEGPCIKCRCVSDIAQPKYECTVTECMRGQCVDGYIPQGACCSVCPNGRNCEANGQIIPAGPVVQMDNGEQCYCENQGWGALVAVCQSEPVPPSYDEPSPPSYEEPSF